MSRIGDNGISGPVYEEFEAVDSIRKIVSKFWYFSCNKDKKKNISFYLLPSYSTSVLYLRGLKTGEAKFVIVSPILRKIKIISSEDIEIAGASVMPLVAGSIFRIKNPSAVNEISEVASVVEEVIFSDVKNKLTEASSADGLVSSLECLFTLLKDKYKQPDPDVSKALRSMLSSAGNLKLEDLYKTLSSSARQFQRKFLAMSGLNPKEFLRLVRLSNVASKLVKDGYNHFDVLTEAGYYDQSHYDREFREIYGTKPTEFEASQKLIKHINLF